MNLYFSLTVNSDKYEKKKKKKPKKLEIWVTFFAKSCVFYRAGEWDDLQFDLQASVHGGVEIQFVGIVPVFKVQCHHCETDAVFSQPSYEGHSREHGHKFYIYRTGNADKVKGMFNPFRFVPDFLILFWLTPDNFTRQGETSWIGKG